jgi:hypothetical protein
MVKLVPALAQKAAQDVDESEGAEVADVAVIVDGRTTGVHPNHAVLQRSEIFELSRKRVEEAEFHAAQAIEVNLRL